MPGQPVIALLKCRGCLVCDEFHVWWYQGCIHSLAHTVRQLLGEYSGSRS